MTTKEAENYYSCLLDDGDSEDEEPTTVLDVMVYKNERCSHRYPLANCRSCAVGKHDKCKVKKCQKCDGCGSKGRKGCGKCSGQTFDPKKKRNKVPTCWRRSTKGHYN